LVVAPDPKVAAWAAQPIANDQGGCRLTPLVLGAETLPRAAPEMLAGRPHTVMLQALMNCRCPADGRLAGATRAFVSGLPAAAYDGRPSMVCSLRGGTAERSRPRSQGRGREGRG
jgi:hypothetical protein